MKIKNISILLNKSESSIYSQLNKLNLNKMWTIEEDFILKNNYGINNFEDYKYLLPNRTKSSIYNRAHYLNLKCIEKIKNKYKFKVNHHFFSDINNISCYWAGFIAADGWIKSDCNCLGIKLAEKDIKHLEKFKFNIQTESPIRKKISTINEKKFEQVQIDIYSRYIIKDLYKNFNITPNKTFTLLPPNIKNFNHKISYIVGLIDGDGCISKKTNTDQIRINLVGNKNIIIWSKQILTEWLNLRKSKLSLKNKIYNVNIGDTGSKKFIKYIKKLNIPYMERKWERYEL